MSFTPSPCSTDQDKWFSRDPQNVEECLSACRKACTIREACLQIALESGETGPESGIWGGYLPEDREAMVEEAEATDEAQAAEVACLAPAAKRSELVGAA